MNAITPLLTLVISLFLAATCCAGQPAPLYAVADIPTPVLNTPDFAGVFGGPDGRTLRTDRCGQLRALEFIALPGTPFRITATLETNGGRIYRVTTDDYPEQNKAGYYIDSRFVTGSANRPPTRERRLPPRETIIANLLAARGSAYVWGGNLRKGLSEMRTFFPPRLPPPLTPQSAARWELRGVDCSGLLYEATGGFTPRNTSLLVGFGRAVPSAGLTSAEIIQRLEPLDLIVWNGHVLIVLDRYRLIESRLDCSGERDGVSVRPLLAALREIMKTRKPLNSYGAGDGGRNGFVVRRWFGSDR